MCSAPDVCSTGANPLTEAGGLCDGDATGRRAPDFGILLFYEYAEVPDVGELVRTLEALCRRLELHGRLRASEEGINGCLSGAWAGCQAFTKAMRDGFDCLFRHTDFKLAPCSEDQQFRGLKVWESAEVCGLFAGEDERRVDAARGLAGAERGQHLSPEVWHEMLRMAGDDVVLFDVRNRYETRIGRFARRDQDGTDIVELVDPETRLYSETPAFLEKEPNLERFRGKRVLMYCTGGVRCERASAFLKRQLDKDAEVYQLSGGIQRYLEAFPDGGFFEGSMHVFDRRGRVSGPEVVVDPAAASSAPAAVLGRCALCEKPWDRYQGRWHCAKCGLLLLVCPPCQGRSRARRDSLQCELCAPPTPGAAARGQAARPAPVVLEAHEAGGGAQAAAAVLPPRLASLAERLEAFVADDTCGTTDAAAATSEMCSWLHCRRLREAVAGDSRQLRALAAVLDRALALLETGTGSNTAAGSVACGCMEAIDLLLRDPPLRPRVHRTAHPGRLALRLLQAAAVGLEGACGGEGAVPVAARAAALRAFWRLAEVAEARGALAEDAAAWHAALVDACREALASGELDLLREGCLAARAAAEHPALLAIASGAAGRNTGLAEAALAALELATRSPAAPKATHEVGALLGGAAASATRARLCGELAAAALPALCALRRNDIGFMGLGPRAAVAAAAAVREFGRKAPKVRRWGEALLKEEAAA